MITTTVRESTSNTYMLASSNTSASVVVKDKEVQDLSITALTSTIIRGNSARFQISSNITIDSPRLVYVNISGNPSNLIPRQYAQEVIINAGENMANFEVMTLEDSNIGFNISGTLTASIPGPNNTEVTAEVKTIDDDIPTGISIMRDSGSISEGETAEFFVVASSTENTDRMITITVDDGSSNVIDTNSDNYPYNQITILQDTQFTRLSVATIVTAESFSTATITATLDPSNTGLAMSNTSVSITVQGKLPELTIVEESVRVTEGQTTTMTIMSNKTSNANLPISLFELSSRTSAFTFEPNNIAISAGDTSVSVEITVPIDVTSDSIYRLAIVSNDLYSTPNDQLMMTILDNDNPNATNPTVSIEPVTSLIVEGNPAQFKISLNPTSATASVSFNLSEGNNAFGTDVNTSQTHTITGTETITVPTRAPNGIDDGTSSITATLELGTGGIGSNYRLADIPNNTATVTITNESRPVLSITADNSTVMEGQPLNFMVSIKPTDAKVEYNYIISETGNFVETRRLGLNTKGISARRYNQITVNTNPVNPDFEPDSVVTLQLEPGLQRDGGPQATPTYFIDPAGSGSASVTVTDSNTPANGLSIVAFNTVINEGDNAEYQIRSASTVTQATEVIVKFTNDTSGRNFITQANLNRPSSITPSADLIHAVNIPEWTKFR